MTKQFIINSWIKVLNADKLNRKILSASRCQIRLFVLSTCAINSNDHQRGCLIALSALSLTHSAPMPAQCAFKNRENINLVSIWRSRTKHVRNFESGFLHRLKLLNCSQHQNFVHIVFCCYLERSIKIEVNGKK